MMMLIFTLSGRNALKMLAGGSVWGMAGGCLTFVCPVCMLFGLLDRMERLSSLRQGVGIGTLL